MCDCCICPCCGACVQTPRLYASCPDICNASKDVGNLFAPRHNPQTKCCGSCSCNSCCCGLYFTYDTCGKRIYAINCCGQIIYLCSGNEKQYVRTSGQDDSLADENGERKTRRSSKKEVTFKFKKNAFKDKTDKRKDLNKKANSVVISSKKNDQMKQKASKANLKIEELKKNKLSNYAKGGKKVDKGKNQKGNDKSNVKKGENKKGNDKSNVKKEEQKKKDKKEAEKRNLKKKQESKGGKKGEKNSNVKKEGKETSTDRKNDRDNRKVNDKRNEKKIPGKEKTKNMHINDKKTENDDTEIVNYEHENELSIDEGDKKIEELVQEETSLERQSSDSFQNVSSEKFENNEEYKRLLRYRQIMGDNMKHETNQIKRIILRDLMDGDLLKSDDTERKMREREDYIHGRRNNGVDMIYDNVKNQKNQDLSVPSLYILQNSNCINFKDPFNLFEYNPTHLNQIRLDTMMERKGDCRTLIDLPIHPTEQRKSFDKKKEPL